MECVVICFVLFLLSSLFVTNMLVALLIFYWYSFCSEKPNCAIFSFHVMGGMCIIMIGIKYENDSVNVYEHKPLLSIYASRFVDRVNFGYVIAKDMNRPYSFLSFQMIVKAT